MSRVGLVTGGASGIGLACAEVLVELGHRVALVGRDPGRLESAAARLPGTLAIPTDVADRVQAAGAVRRTVQALGGLDVVVANAGVFPSRRRLDDVTEDEWRDTVAVNLDGAFHIVAEALVHLRARGGYVFAVSSVYASGGMRLGAPYAASKAAVEGLVHSLVQEWEEHGVRATVLAPGIVDTAMAGDASGRATLLPPRDVAEGIRFCLGLSPAALVRKIVIERSEVARIDRELQEDTPRWLIH